MGRKERQWNEYLGPVEEKNEWIEIGKLLDKVML